MQKTNLPYNFEDMNDIKNNGAIVDMSCINFPTIEANNNPRVSLIYLRNTNFDNIHLDFNHCNYEFKSECLKYFMNGDIIFNVIEYKSTWQKIILAYNNLYANILSILSDEEIAQFITENLDLVKGVDEFLKSLSVYAMMRLDWEDDCIDFSDIKHCEKALFNKNAYYLIEKEFIDYMYMENIVENNQPIIFDEHFVKDNEELFSLLVTETPFITLFYGMTTDKWSDFIDNIVKQNETKE